MWGKLSPGLWLKHRFHSWFTEPGCHMRWAGDSRIFHGRSYSLEGHVWSAVQLGEPPVSGSKSGKGSSGCLLWTNGLEAHSQFPNTPLQASRPHWIRVDCAGPVTSKPQAVISLGADATRRETSAGVSDTAAWQRTSQEVVVMTQVSRSLPPSWRS